MTSPWDARHVVGPAVVLGAPVSEQPSGLRTSRGVLMHAGAPRLCTVRELLPSSWDRDGDFEARAARWHQRARLLRSLEGTGAPTLYAALGGAGGVTTTLESPHGDLSLRALLGRVPHPPPGLAVHVVRSLARMWALAGTFEAVHPSVMSDELSLTWSGEVVPTHEELFTQLETMAAGAMVAILPHRVGYRSPEQIRGLPASDAVAFFNAGLFFYEALTGSDPFEGESGFQLLVRIVEARMRPLQDARPGLPPAMYAFFERCTRRAPEERHASWAELYADLDALTAQLGRFEEGELAALLAHQFPQQRAAAAVLEDFAATFDVNAARKRLEFEPREPLAIAPWPARRAGNATARTPREDVVWAGTDSRPMLRAGALLADRRPVTNAEYARFVLDTGRAPPSHWGRATPPVELEDAPVTFVSQPDAVLYAAWAGKRLPEDHEWALILQHLGSARLGSGQVWEWTASARHSGWVVRGGVWRDRPDLFDAASSSWESKPARDVGFRCVRDA